MAMDLAGNEANSIGFLLCVWRLVALFPFDWSIKSALPLFRAITESNFRRQAVWPCAACCKEFPLHSSEVGPRETVGNISSRFIERSINRSLLQLTLWPLPADPLDLMLPVRVNWSKNRETGHRFFLVVYILSVFHYLRPHLGAKTGHLQTLHPTNVSQGSLWNSKYPCCWLTWKQLNFTGPSTANGPKASWRAGSECCRGQSGSFFCNYAVRVWDCFLDKMVESERHYCSRECALGRGRKASRSGVAVFNGKPPLSVPLIYCLH